MESYKDILISYPQSSGSSNLGFDYFQIFDYIQIFKYIREYFLRIIFLFMFMTQGVKNNIHIRICIKCLLKIIFIFVFVHQKNDSLRSSRYYTGKGGSANTENH